MSDLQSPTPLEYFSGGLPAGICFQMTLEDVRAILNTGAQAPRLSTLCQLCLIGLVGYFEAFLKDHFASIINSLPQLLFELKKKNHNVQVDATKLLSVEHPLMHALGFAVAENLDFGTAKKANALYTSAISITPFSKQEARRYDGVLRDRNLIVHHGATYTPSFLEQAEACDPNRARAYLDSLVLDPDRVLTDVEFLENTARKLVLQTPEALLAKASSLGTVPSSEQLEAFNAAGWWQPDP